MGNAAVPVGNGGRRVCGISGRITWIARQGHWVAIMVPIDWTECAPIETVPGQRGGRPVIKVTRLRPMGLRTVTNQEQGSGWLVENQGGIKPDPVLAVLGYYDNHKKARVPHLA